MTYVTIATASSTACCCRCDFYIGRRATIIKVNQTFREIKCMTISTLCSTCFNVPAVVERLLKAFFSLSNRMDLKRKRVIIQIFPCWSYFETMGWGPLARVSVYFWVMCPTCAKNAHLNLVRNDGLWVLWEFCGNKKITVMTKSGIGPTYRDY